MDAEQDAQDHAGALNPVEAYRQQNRHWKRIAAMLAVALIVMASIGVYSIMQNRRTLDILTKATGEEAQAAQVQVVDHLVFRIKCDNREALQEVLDQLAPQRGVTVLSNECKENE